jgi:hypothetical protein
MPTFRFPGNGEYRAPRRKLSGCHLLGAIDGSLGQISRHGGRRWGIFVLVAIHFFRVTGQIISALAAVMCRNECSPQ